MYLKHSSVSCHVATLDTTKAVALKDLITVLYGLPASRRQPIGTGEPVFARMKVLTVNVGLDLPTLFSQLANTTTELRDLAHVCQFIL